MAKRLNKNVVGGLTALAFVVITAAGVFMVSSLRKVDPEQHAQKAQHFAAEGDYEKARIYYGRAFQVSEPKNAKYLVNVGNMYELDGEEMKALAAWNEAKTVDPSLLEAHEKLLDVYMQVGRPLQIKETAEAVLRLEAKNPKALHALGTALIRLAGQPEGDREKGFANLEEAHAVAPEVFDYVQALAVNYWSDGAALLTSDPEQARRRITDALNLAKDLVARNQTPGKDAANARLLYAGVLSAPFAPDQEKFFLGLLGEHLGGGDRFTAAERLYQQAVEMAGPEAEVQSDALTTAATYWFRRSLQETNPAAKEQQRDQAQTLADQAMACWPTGFNSYTLLAQIYANNGENLKAAEVCTKRTDLPIDRKGIKAAQQKRNRFQLLLLTAEQFVVAASSSQLTPGGDEQLDLARKAEQALVDAQAEIPDAERDPASLHVLGKIRLVQGKNLEALSYFEKAEKARPGFSWQNQHFLGVLRLEQGQIGGARAALMEATRDPRAGAATWLALAKVHLASDEPEVAILAADEALKRTPDLAEARRVKIAANQKLGRASQVETELKGWEATQTKPEQAIFRVQLLYQQAKYQEALDLLQKMLAENPTSEVALRALGPVAAKVGKQAEALALVQKAIQADPENFGFRALAINLTPDLTDPQRRERLLTLIQETPDEYLRAFRLGEFYRTGGQNREALEQFGKAAQLVRSRTTESAKRAGPAGLLVALDKQLGLALDLEAWDQVDAIAQIAAEENVDGAHGMTFKGRALLVRKQYDAATDALNQALAEQPSQSESWTWLGEAHFLADRKSEARSAFTRAAEMNPENFMAQRRLAQLSKDGGDLTEFNARLDRCVQLNPDDPWVKQQELVRQEEKNPQEGIARREAMLQQNPNDLANRVQLARLYQLAGNVEKATEHYTAALGSAEAPTGVAWRAAQFFAENGDEERAFQVLSDAREGAQNKQDQATFLLMAGTLYRQLDKPDLSEQQFRKAVDLDPGQTTFVAFGEHYLALKQYKEAVEWLDKGIAAADQAGSPRAADFRRVRFDTLVQIGDRAAAEAAVKDFRERFPKDPVGFLLEGEFRVLRGEIEQAVASFTQFLQANPGNPSALYRRAQLYAGLQKWPAAISDLENLRALNRDALNYAPRILLSRAYDLTDRSDLALSELKALYEEHPDNDAIGRYYFQYFMKHKRSADAESLATALVNRDPNNPWWKLCLGQAAAENKDGVKALANLREAAEKAEYDWRYCNELLNAYAQFKNYDAGIRFYEESIPAAKRRSPTTYRYANLLVEKGRVDDALNAYRQALVEPTAYRDELFVVEVASNAARALGASRVVDLFRTPPTDETLKRPNQHLLAALLANFDQRAEAQTVLDGLISASTDDAERASLYGRKGVVAQADGDYTLAQQNYEQAVKIHPDNYVVLNNLAYLLADQLKKPAEAVPYAERAMRLNGQKEVVDTLAWALVELKEYGRAVGLLTGVVQRDPEWITGLVHLAEAYRRAGNFEEAVPQYEQAFKLIEQTGDNEQRELAETGLKKARDKVVTP